VAARRARVEAEGSVRTLRILHKWLGLLVGIQLLLWTVSGLVFAWLDHQDVAGERSVRVPPSVAIPGDSRVLEPAILLADYANLEIREVTLMPVQDIWVYRVRLPSRIELRRAADGARFEIAEPVIRDLARSFYSGEGSLKTVSLLAEPTLEVRNAGPVWRADFDDRVRSSLYFAAEDGRFVAARNDTWRLFDFFWMLHTMDYRGRDNFNHPLVILCGTGALWLGISGAFLLWQAFRPVRRLASESRSKT